MAQGLCFFGMGRLLSAAGVVGAIAILLALAIQGQAESDVWISAFDVDGDEVWPSSSVLATAQLMIQCQAALQWVHPAELMLDVEVEFGRTAWVHANAPSSWRISIEDCLDVGPEGLPQVLTRQIAAGVQASSNAPAHLVQEIPVSGRVSGPETPEGAGHFNGSLAVVPGLAKCSYGLRENPLICDLSFSIGATDRAKFASNFRAMNRDGPSTVQNCSWAAGHILSRRTPKALSSSTGTVQEGLSSISP
jgi:hypothetical protein